MDSAICASNRAYSSLINPLAYKSPYHYLPYQTILHHSTFISLHIYHCKDSQSLIGINRFYYKTIKKVQKMKFKTHQSSTPSVDDLLDSHEHQAPPEQQSILTNDPNNPFRTFLENIRTLIANSLDQDSQQFVVVFGVDQETGYLSMGITRQAPKQQESDGQDYRAGIEETIDTYEKAQMELIKEHNRLVKHNIKSKTLMQRWKALTEFTSPLRVLSRSLMESIDVRMGKPRSDSKDTAQTLEYYSPIANQQQWESMDDQGEEESRLDLDYMMEVE